MIYCTGNVIVNTWTDRALKYSVVHDMYMLSSLIIYHGREELVSHSHDEQMEYKSHRRGTDSYGNRYPKDKARKS